jgi:hypothetical protein
MAMNILHHHSRSLYYFRVRSVAMEIGIFCILYCVSSLAKCAVCVSDDLERLGKVRQGQSFLTPKFHTLSDKNVHNY